MAGIGAAPSWAQAPAEPSAIDVRLQAPAEPTGVGARAQIPAESPAAAALARARAKVVDGDLAAAIALLEPWHGESSDGKSAANEARRYLDAVRGVRAVSVDLERLYEKGGKAGVAGALEALRENDEVRADPYLVAEVAAVERALTRLDDARTPKPSLLEKIIGSPKSWLPSGIVLAQILVAIAILAAVWRVMRAIRKRNTKKNRRAEIAIIDASSGKASPDPVLASQLVSRLRALSLPRRKGTGLDQDSDLGEMLPQWEPTFQSELKSLRDMVADGEAVKIGIFKIPVRALLGWFMRAFGTERYLWAGEIVRGSSGSRLTIWETDRATGARRFWTATTHEKDAGATADLLDEIAVNLALGVQDDPFPHKPDAYRAYLRSLEILDDVYESTERDKALEEAREQLQRAIRIEPSLWRARFRLGIVLRKLGDRERAAAIFEDLREEHGLRDDDRLDLEYHRAVLEGQYRSIARLDKARQMLATLRQKLEARSPAPPLLYHVRSFDAALASEIFAFEDDEYRMDERSAQKLEADIRREVEFFGGAPPKDLDLRTWTACRAFVLRAEGKRLIRRARFDEGIALLQKAIVLVPELSAAYVELGSAHRRRKQSGAEEGITWFDEAERALLEALRMTPDDPRANLEWARALLEVKPPQVDRAVQHLMRASRRRPSARWELGRIMARQQNKIDDGIALMWQAIEMLSERAPARYAEELIEIVSAVPVDRQSSQQVELADVAYRWLLAQRGRLDASQAVPVPIAAESQAHVSQDLRAATVRRFQKAVERVSSKAEKLGLG